MQHTRLLPRLPEYRPYTDILPSSIALICGRMSRVARSFPTEERERGRGVKMCITGYIFYEMSYTVSKHSLRNGFGCKANFFSRLQGCGSSFPAPQERERTERAIQLHW